MKTNPYLAKVTNPVSRSCFYLLFFLLAFYSCKPKIHHLPVYRIDQNMSIATQQKIQLAPGDIIEMEFLQLYSRIAAPAARFAPVRYKVRVPLRDIPEPGNLKDYEKLFLITCLATLVDWDSTRIKLIPRESLDAELFKVWKNMISASFIQYDGSSRNLKITNTSLLAGTRFQPLRIADTINNAWIIRPDFNRQFDRFFDDNPDEGSTEPLNSTYYNKAAAPIPATIIFSSVLKNGVRYSMELSEHEEGRWSLRDWADSRAVYLKKSGSNQIDTLTRARISSITLKKEYTPDGRELDVFIKEAATGTLRMRTDGKIIYTDPNNKGTTKDIQIPSANLSEVYPYMLESVKFTWDSPKTPEEKQSK